MTFDEKVTEFLNKEDLTLTIHSTPYADKGNLISVGYVEDNQTNLLTEGKTFEDAMINFIDRYENTTTKEYTLELTNTARNTLINVLNKCIKFIKTFGVETEARFLECVVDTLQKE